MTALKIGGGSYDTESPAAHHICINLYPEAIEDYGRTQVILRQCPGLPAPFSTVNRPVRGMHVMGDVLYVVGDDTLYSIDHLGTATAQSGTITTTALNVSMANNNKSTQELLILDGGGTSFHDQYFLVSGLINEGYIYTASGTVTAIADTDFPPHGTNEHAFSSSNLEAGTAWTATDFAEAEGNPDKVRGHTVSNRDLFVFGRRTIEFYRDVPSGADFPFTRSDGSFQERGCLSRFSIAGSGALNVPGSDNTVYWLGDDKIVYRIENYTPNRISNHALERALEKKSTKQLNESRGYTYNMLGHYFYSLTVGPETWVYDATTSGLLERATWHQRRTGVDTDTPWRITHLVQAYGKYYGGDAEGNIFEIDPETYNDNGSPMKWVRTVGPYFNEDRDLSCKKVTLVMDTGTQATGSDDAQVSLRISRDGGRTWGNRLDRDIGKVGERRKEVSWRRLGRSSTHGFVFEFSASDNVRTSLVEAYAEFDGGS